MLIKESSSHIEINDNRLPPAAKYHLTIVADFNNIDHALSFNEDIIKLIANYREPALVINQPVNMENKNDGI